MKKLLSLILAIAMFLSVCSINVSAMPAPYYYGDVNENGDIEITDATEIQRHLAKIVQLSKLGNALADVDNDEKVSIFDVTMIQLKLADLITSFNQNPNFLYALINIYNVGADFDSGKAMVKVPVTFTARAGVYDAEPARYEYYIIGGPTAIDGYVYSDEDPNFTYTFYEAGTYTIELRVYNRFDMYESYKFDYTVVEANTTYDLMISAVYVDSFYPDNKSDTVIVTHAYGSTAPYEYKFDLDNGAQIQEYSQSNSISLSKLSIGTHSINVSVKDSLGNEVSTTYSFEVYQAMNS